MFPFQYVPTVIDEGTSTDPGQSNVLVDVNYFFDGNPRTGTLDASNLNTALDNGQPDATDAIIQSGKIIGDLTGTLESIVLPVASNGATISIAQGSLPSLQWILVDASGNPVNVESKAIRFVATNPNDQVMIQADSGFNVTGSSFNTVSLQTTADQTSVSFGGNSALWDITDNVLLQQNPFSIFPVQMGSGISGSGNTTVTVNTPTIDNLRAVDGYGNGVPAVSINAYTLSAWQANTASTPILATSITGADGRWLNNMLLSSGAVYAIVFKGPPGSIEAVSTISI